MISLSKVDNAIKFTFTDSQHYLYGNGIIEAPVNSLLLVEDESDFATFKKPDGDVFVSASYSEFGMSKSDLLDWYKNNMVGSTGGGGGSDVTSAQVQTMIDESISGKADTSAVTAVDNVLTAHTADTTIHVTSADKTAWNAKSDFSGSYNDLTDKPTIPTVPTSNTAFTNDAGYATSGYVDSAVSGKVDAVSAVSSAEYVESSTTIDFKNIDGTVISSIDASDFIVDGMVDDVRIETISGASYLVIDFNTASGKEDIQIPLTDIFDASNYYTKAEVDSAISGATDDMATQTWVGNQGYITGVDLSDYATEEFVNASTSGKADTSAVTAVNDVLTAHTADTTIHVTSADKSAWNAKSDFSGSYNDLTDKPTIPTVPTDVSAFNNDAGYITEDAISGKADTSAVTAVNNVLTAHTADTTIHVTSSDKSTWSGKQDALVSGTNIKTINNQSLLGSGNITISGGSGSGTAAVEVTQAEYDSMVSGGTVDPTVFYIITDAPAIEASGFVQTSAITSAVTSASTDSQIPTAKAVYDAIPTGGTSITVDQTLDSGSTNPVANSAITTAINSKVNISDNNVSAFSGVPLAINVNEGYHSLQLKTIYIKNNDATKHTNVVFGEIKYHNGSYNNTTIISGSSISSSGITAITNTDTTAHTFTLENGVCRIDFLGSCYFTQINSEGDGFSFYYIHNNNYTSGQSSTVIENTVYDALTELGKDIVDMNDSGRFVNVSKDQDITATKTFVNSDKGIIFKQKNNYNKIGFLLTSSASTNNEVATFEFRPNTYTDSSSVSHPLLYFGHYRSTNVANNGIVQTMVGFRQYDQQGEAAYHYLMPLPAEAKTPFSLNTSFKNYFAPLGFKNGDTMITTDNTGVADFSSVLGGLKLVKLTQAEYTALSPNYDASTVYIIVN